MIVTFDLNKQSENAVAARIKWAQAHDINPFSMDARIFVDTDKRVIYWCEVVETADASASVYPEGPGKGLPFPASTIPSGRLGLKDYGPARLVVQRETPLLADPPTFTLEVAA